VLNATEALISERKRVSTRMKSVVRYLVPGVCALLLVGGLTGCGNTKVAADSSPEKPKSEYALVIGVGKSGMKKVALSNETSMTIAKVALKGSTETTWTQQPVMSRSWNKGEKALIYYSEPVTATPTASSANTDPDHDIALRPALDVRLTFRDGKTAVLHALQLDDLVDGSFCFDAPSGLAFLSYSEGGKHYTTLEAEKALKARQEATAKAAADKAAADAAAAKAVADKAAAAKASAKSSSKKKSSGSKSSGSSKVKQQGDQCVGDLLLK